MTLHLSHWNPPLDRKGMEQRWQCWLKAEINAKAQGTGATPRRRGEPTHKLNGTSKCVWGFVCLPEAVGGSSSYKSRRKKKKGRRWNARQLRCWVLRTLKPYPLPQKRTTYVGVFCSVSPIASEFPQSIKVLSQVFFFFFFCHCRCSY